MNRTLRYIGISHKNASVAQRDMYHFSDEEKNNIAELICHTFSDIAGLFILVTCNRTEFYFETETTSATDLRDFLICLKEDNLNKKNKQLFGLSNTTKETVRHLLEVSSGLTSAVLGDAEIIHQIKKAHQYAIAHKLQGSLLERAMQTIFKNHKRLSNETHFRDGTTSIAYKSLKVVGDFYKKSSEGSKKMLFVGAGDIVKQLFKYNSKFNFDNIYISNRTEEKAIALSKLYHCEVYDWNKVRSNNFEDFDVVISAASNCHHLIKNIPATATKKLLIDLAIPENIDKALANNSNVKFYNLDGISSELEDNKEKRLAAIGKVNEIIKEELAIFSVWLQEAPLRKLLAKYKILVDRKVTHYFEADREAYDLHSISNQVMRKLIKQPEKLVDAEVIETIITEQVSLLKESYN